jgi:hypothetical protein
MVGCMRMPHRSWAVLETHVNQPYSLMLCGKTEASVLAMEWWVDLHPGALPGSLPRAGSAHACFILVGVSVIVVRN